jgi:hypothetical protein
LGYTLGKVLVVGVSFLKEFFEVGEIWKEFLLRGGKILRIEAVDPLA